MPLVAAVKSAEAAGCQVVTVAMLGHKCDAAVMAVHPNLRELRTLQTAVQHAGLEVVDSYVSISEVSEYAAQMPEEMKRAQAVSDDPAEPRRLRHAGVVLLPDEQASARVRPTGSPCRTRRRSELMHEHGASGRKFAGRIAQYITGSAGLDDYEWGVTLFGVHPDDLKEVVYTMRFDEASAVYAEFGPFYTGMVTPVEELMAVEL